MTVETGIDQIFPNATQEDYNQILERIKAEKLIAPSADFLRQSGLHYAAQIVDEFAAGVVEFKKETEVESFAGLPTLIAKANQEIHPYTPDRFFHDLELIREKYGVVMVCTEVGGGPKLISKLPPALKGQSDEEVIENVRSLLSDLQEMGYDVAMGYNDFSFAATYKSPRVGSNHLKEDGTVDKAMIRDMYDHGLFAAARQYQDNRSALVNGQIRVARVAHADEVPMFYVKGVGLVEDDETGLIRALRSCSPEDYADKVQRYNYNLAVGKIDVKYIGGWRRQGFDVVGSGKVIKQIHDANNMASVPDSELPENFKATEKPVNPRTKGLEAWVDFLVNSAGILSQAHIHHQRILEESLDEIQEYVPFEEQVKVRNGYGLRAGEWLDIVYPDIWRYVAVAEGGDAAKYYFDKYNRKVAEMVLLMNIIFSFNNEGSYSATNFPVLNTIPGEQWNELRAEGTFYNWTTQGVYLDKKLKAIMAAIEGAYAGHSTTASNRVLGDNDQRYIPNVNVNEYTPNGLFTLPHVASEHIAGPNYIEYERQRSIENERKRLEEHDPTSYEYQKKRAVQRAIDQRIAKMQKKEMERQKRNKRYNTPYVVDTSHPDW